MFYEGDPDNGTLSANVGAAVDDEPIDLLSPAQFSGPSSGPSGGRSAEGCWSLSLRVPGLGAVDRRHGYRLAAHGRKAWLRTAAEAGGVEGRVIEIQLPFASKP